MTSDCLQITFLLYNLLFLFEKKTQNVITLSEEERCAGCDTALAQA